MKRTIIFAITAMMSLLAASCGGGVQKGIEVRTVEVVKEVQRPCPVKLPERPASVQPDDVPPDARDAVLFLYAALLGWQGAGKYGDQADAAIEICTRDD